MDLQLDGLDKAELLDSEKINNGVWIHLDSSKTDPATGKPLKMYLGGDAAKPQRALVRSNRCQLIRAAEKAQQRTSMVKIRLAKKAERDDVIADSTQLPDEKRFGLHLAALENFSAAGGIQLVSQEAGAQLFSNDSVAHIIQQVRETAFDDAPYLATADTEVGNVSLPAKAPATKTEPLET